MDTKKILEIFNQAMEFKKNGDLISAEKNYKEILSMTTVLPEVYYNLALVYARMFRFHEAIDNMKIYLKSEPDDIEGRYFLSTYYFMLRDFDKGLELFESRVSKTHAIMTEAKTYGNLYSDIPFWSGEDLTDKVIFVYYEAGLGDTLMYFRYLKELSKVCKKVYFKPQISLLSLFAENRGDVKIIMHVKESISKECDYQCPIMSIPYLLGLNNKNIFVHTDKFLHASKKKKEYYKQKYFNNDLLKICVKWQGNTLIGGERAITAKSFEKIFTLANTQIYSVQVNEGQEQLNELSCKHNIIDLGSTFKDFSDTAGAIANADIVICNDTSVAHLAGAMGVKTYVILPENYDWRWHDDISKCYWYNSIKLYQKQTTWEDVVDKIYNDILVNL